MTDVCVQDIDLLVNGITNKYKEAHGDDGVWDLLPDFSPTDIISVCVKYCGEIDTAKIKVDAENFSKTFRKIRKKENESSVVLKQYLYWLIFTDCLKKVKPFKEQGVIFCLKSFSKIFTFYTYNKTLKGIVSSIIKNNEHIFTTIEEELASVLNEIREAGVSI